MLLAIRDGLSQAHEGVLQIRTVRQQVDSAVERAKKAGGSDTIEHAADELKKKLETIEDRLHQKRSRSSQDPLNFPIQLNDKIGGLGRVIEGDWPVTEQAKKVWSQLSGGLAAQIDALANVIEHDVAAFNELIRQHDVPAVVVDEEDEG
jgi:hypothetical protein